MHRLRVAGIAFEHMHMGDNLRLALLDREVEVVGVADEDRARMDPVAAALGIPPALRYTDWRACLAETKPDLVLLCPKTADHRQWVERMAASRVHVLIEKPFAASLADADLMIEAMKHADRKLAINWPLAWVPAHQTARRLVREGTIGELREVHYFGGNRGPLWHGAHKEAMTAEFVEKTKATSWWYQRAAGGGSLLDYLGYGATLGTWFLDGRAPTHVTAMVDTPPGLEVDEHSVTLLRYPFGLSKLETRWGTFTDPWVHQTTPPSGFTLCGTDGTIASHDYAASLHVQTRAHPEGREVLVDVIKAPFRNPIEAMVHWIRNDLPVSGPLDPKTSRIGQRIVDTAARAAETGATLPLLGGELP